MKIHQNTPQQTSAVTPANEVDIDDFYDALGSCSTKPAIYFPLFPSIHLAMFPI